MKQLNIAKLVAVILFFFHLAAKTSNLLGSQAAKTHQQSAVESVWLLFTSSGSLVTRQHEGKGGSEGGRDWFIQRDASVIKQVISVAPWCVVSGAGDVVKGFVCVCVLWVEGSLWRDTTLLSERHRATDGGISLAGGLCFQLEQSSVSVGERHKQRGPLWLCASLFIYY